MAKLLAYLASRQLRLRSNPDGSGRKTGISAVSAIAFLTILVGSAAGLATLSAVNGIHARFIEKLTAKDAHVSILGMGRGIPDYDKYLVRLRQIHGVRSAEPFFEGRALLKGNETWAASVMGLTPESLEKDSDFKRLFSVREGTLNLSKPSTILLGDQLAFRLGVTNGSIITLIVYRGDQTGDIYPFRVGGIFSLGFSEYDSVLSLISFSDAQRIYEFQGFAYGIGVKVDKPDQIEKYLPEIRKACPFFQYTWKTANRNNLFALKDEKLLIEIILVLFFLVVGFNILSAMLGLALDKKEETAILKAMGLHPGGALRLFLLDGFLLGVIGSLCGIFTGLALAQGLNGILSGIEILVNGLNSAGYYIASIFKHIDAPAPFAFFATGGYVGKFPMVVEFSDIIFIVLLSTALSMVAVIPPAIRAARMRPVEVLRND